jgi:hypothetical protein
MRKGRAIALILLAAAAAAASSAYGQVPPSNFKFSDWVVKNTYEPTARRLLYTAARSVGMLRGVEEHDAIVRIRYKGSGTAYEVSKAGDWRPLKLENYYVEVDFSEQGIRIDKNAPTGRTVQVAYRGKAWDEVGVAPEGPPAGKSQTVVTSAAALKERRLQIALTPLGAIKAAKANIANAKVVRLGDGLYQLTFPYDGHTMRLSLDANRRPSKVEIVGVEHPVLGRTTLSAEYSGYKDYEPIYPQSNEPHSDFFFPSRIVQKLGGKVVLDARIDTCWSSNPYVVFPEPGSYRAGDA